MKEFVEKLISRLEEEKQKEVHDYNYKEATGLRKAISIVNELEKEYNQEHDDTDYANIELYAFWQKHQWISVSDRLPETNESVLCWAKSTARGGDVCFVGSCHNGFWFLQSSADTHSFPGQYVIVAWQPIAPYQPKGE